jgi:hypothetical protein
VFFERQRSWGATHLTTAVRFVLFAAMLSLTTTSLFAKVTGSISGTARDSQGAVVPGASVQLRNIETGVVQTTETDSAGFYNFPAIAVGHYNITFQKTGFSDFTETGLTINVDTTLQVDAPMHVGTVQQQVTVKSAAVEVDTRTAQIGEVIGAKEMTNLPLNGRAYTDLLTLQPGVVPISTSQYGTLLPSNSLNNGLLSMGGARDVNSGFMINGADVVEGFGAGTPVVPNLDSIAEFRIITSNAGAEYGNYAGGLVNVVTKSGTNQFHGDVFEFLRNSDLDSRNYFSPTRGVFRQNQFGGTLGGPILRNKLFFFGDYQGTRQTIGLATGNILVPSAAERQGDFSSPSTESQLTGSVVGSAWANTLSARLGYTVAEGEPYYTSGCTSSADCVFPNAMIPQSAWDSVGTHMVPLIPAANSGIYFSTSAYPETLQDDKGAVRIDTNTRIGQVSAYYHYNPWTNNSPYSSCCGSSVPGFPNDTIGGAQLATFSVTTTFGPSLVNQFVASLFRNRNISGKTPGGGPTPSEVGFAAPADGGVVDLTPVYQNYPTVYLNNYALGPPESYIGQFDNTYQFQDDVTKVVGTHTLKFGAAYHWDLVDISRVNSKTTFNIYGDETGYDFADLLIGAPDNFFQATLAALDLRNFYVGAYGEDSWRMSHNLTVSYGLRWDVDPYWAEAENREPVITPGLQSTQFPGAPVGYDFPGDPGIPKHMANIRWNDFSPRISLAYSPDVSHGFLHSFLGDHGKSSLRVGYGMYYTNIEGSSVYNFSAAPYGYHYTSPDPPLMYEPFISRASGYNNGQRFPLPPVTSPASINWSEFEPISGDRNPLVNSPSPYTEHMDVSLERAVTPNTMATVSYVGTFGHHLILNADHNPGNSALCLSLRPVDSVMPGTPRCGPNLEHDTFYPVGGGAVYGTRAPLGQQFLGIGVELDDGNSSYNGLEATLRHVSGRQSILLSYTYSKAMDDGSGFGEQVIFDPTTGKVTPFRALSLYDMPNNFSASYTVELPFDKMFGKDNNATRGWKISGITEFTNGLPITFFEVDDHNLLGSTGNSGYYGSTDFPEYTPGNIYNDKNPRHGNAYFNTSLFSPEAIGQEGNTPRRFFHGPGIDNWDLSLLKDVRLGESRSLEFRAEFFNAFNHAQFDGPFAADGDIGDGPGGFGYVTSAADPRIGQVAAKFYF